MIKSNDQERNPVELLCEEFLERRRKGESPTIEEYASAHKSLQKEIRSLFPTMLAMEEVKGSSVSAGSRPICLSVDRLEQLGDYRVVKEIGRGGMAIVYEAEQQSLRRRVALKVFPDQLFEDTAQLQRFEREARTVASLHHQNIVPVFGSGQENGMHYFVMQLLDGITLHQVIQELHEFAETRTIGFEPLRQIVSRWKKKSSAHTTCSQNASNDSAVEPLGELSFELNPNILESLSTRESKSAVQQIHFQRDKAYWQRVAEIGIQVADALDYAHRKGVLHRDIKPSNLILDGEWRTWVTDFGLAHEASLEPISKSGDLVGTLLYMAPERLNGTMDARSDIYSLGLTLYELLTFRPAYAGYGKGELRQQILNFEPPNPRAVSRDVPADLETIVLKAMAKDPASRYQSASEFSLDLRNFVEERPINARRASIFGRLKRWSRRNPAIACMSAVLLCCIVSSMAVVTFNWQRAVEEGNRAESNMNLALEGMERLLVRFEADWMEHPIAPDSSSVDGPTESRFVVSDRSVSILQEALLFYEEFAAQNTSNPHLQLETARAHRRVGVIYERLGQLEEAESAFQKELDTLLAIAPASKTQAVVVALAESRNRLAMVNNSLYKHHIASRILRNASSDLTSHLQAHGQSEDALYSLAKTQSNIGKVLWWMRVFPRSKQKHREAIAIFEQLVENSPRNVVYRLSLARAYRDYRFASFGQNEDSRNLQDSAATLLESLVHEFPDVPDYRCELGELLTGAAQFGQGSVDERVCFAERALTLVTQLADEYPRIPRYQAARARALWVSASQIAHSSLSEAELLHNASVELYLSLCKKYPDVNDYRMFAAQALVAQSKCKIKLGKTGDARIALEQAVQSQKDYLETRRNSIFGHQWLSDYLVELASLEREEGNEHRAEQLLLEAQTVRDSTRGGPFAAF